MHGLLTSWGTLGNYIFIMLICSSNLFKVTVIKITFSPPRSKRNSRDVFLMLLPRSSPPLSLLFFLSLSLSNCNAQLACRERERQWGLFGENSSHVRGWKMASSTNRGIDQLIGGGGHHIKRDRNKQTGQDQGYFFSHILVFLKEIRTCYHHSVHPTSVHVCSA